MVEIEQAYFSIPVVTRIYLTLAVLTSGAVTFEFLSPLGLYLNLRLVAQGEIWRLLTSFVYFDTFSVHFFFHMHFLYFYSRRLEEHFYHRRTARFVYMLLFGATLMVGLASVYNIPFLSHSLVMMVLYVWSRRNPDEHLSFYFGLVTLSAPYLAFLLLGLGMLFGSSPVADLIGIAVGHVFWYIEDILPRLLGRPHSKELIPTPGFLQALFPQEVGNEAHE
eukprot:TRINITY_DN25845_c0_g1_i1.p2 TRINITY_DN25845_c0_g1~~TRINITY_DN25845_c0_g1_i1.p2  ORF type:complete len:241 (+),score=93.67 TRINITY_DN25845_c0_g1_i1:62-724(+)